MTWKIGISHGESFVEFAASNQEKLSAPKARADIHQRVFLNRTRLADAFLQFITTHSIAPEQVEIILASRWAHQIIRKKMGNSFALLVTAGFESWPLLWDAEKHHGFRRRDILQLADFFSKDHIFGISERVTADGQVESSCAEADLDFIFSKLELEQIKNVAVCFLNSTVNPKNEKQVVEFLRTKGLRAWSSHEVADFRDETVRWLTCAVQAYTHQGLSEYLEELQKIVPAEKIRLLCGNELLPASVDYWHRSIQQPLIEMPAQNGDLPVLYLGLEQFLLVLPDSSRSDLEYSTVGEVYHPHRSYQKLKVQPTSTVQISPFGVAIADKPETGFEPGPMAFGRGLRLTFFDVLYFLEKLSPIAGVQEQFAERSRARIAEALFTLGKGQSVNRLSDMEVASMVLQQSLQTLVMDINFSEVKSKLIVCGAMAETFVPLLKERLPFLNIILDDNLDFKEANTLLKRMH